MPMAIQNEEEYDKVLNVSWYTPEKPREEQMYVYHFFSISGNDGSTN